MPLNKKSTVRNPFRRSKDDIPATPPPLKSQISSPVITPPRPRTAPPRKSSLPPSDPAVHSPTHSPSLSRSPSPSPGLSPPNSPPLLAPPLSTSISLSNPNNSHSLSFSTLNLNLSTSRSHSPQPGSNSEWVPGHYRKKSDTQRELAVLSMERREMDRIYERAKAERRVLVPFGE